MASLERRVAVDAARAAGQLLKSELPGSRRIAYKGGPTNLVTEMDARVEELIVGRLSGGVSRRRRPRRGARRRRRDGPGGAGSSIRWTARRTTPTGFRPSACRSALESAGHVELGVVYDPNLDEMFVAERGHGATVNDRPLAVSTAADARREPAGDGIPLQHPRGRGQQLEGVRRVQRARPCRAADGLSRPRSRLAGRRTARRLLGASARRLGRRRRQPARRGGGRPDHRLDGRRPEPRLALARRQQRPRSTPRSSTCSERSGEAARDALRRAAPCSLRRGARAEGLADTRRREGRSADARHAGVLSGGGSLRLRPRRVHDGGATGRKAGEHGGRRRASRVAAANAVLANATLAHGLDFDDTREDAIVHTGCVAVHDEPRRRRGRRRVRARRARRRSWPPSR